MKNDRLVTFSAGESVPISSDAQVTNFAVPSPHINRFTPGVGAYKGGFRPVSILNGTREALTSTFGVVNYRFGSAQLPVAKKRSVFIAPGPTDAATNSGATHGATSGVAPSFAHNAQEAGTVLYGNSLNSQIEKRDKYRGQL